MSKRNILLAVLLALTTYARAGSLPDSVTIPLTLEHLSNGDYKLGISVSLGGGPSKLYEFDTGGTGFYAANNTAWWSNYTTVSPNEVTMMYASGITYNATVVTTTVDLGYGLPVLTANMGQIQQASGNDVLNWNSNVANNIPPLYNNFFGDFGADLSTQNGLFGMLSQLPGNLSNGFIIRTGGFGNPTPTLQIGITDADRALFPYAVSMQNNSTVVFPVSGYDTHDGALTSGNASFSNGTQTVAFPTDYVIDTGAPSMDIFNAGADTLPADFIDASSHVVTNITGNFFIGNFSFGFSAGNVSGLNRIGYTTGNNSAVNTGLIPYFENDIMFDLQDGYVRFAPLEVPEPASFVLIAGIVAGSIALGHRCRRKS